MRLGVLGVCDVLPAEEGGTVGDPFIGQRAGAVGGIVKIEFAAQVVPVVKLSDSGITKNGKRIKFLQRVAIGNRLGTAGDGSKLGGADGRQVVDGEWGVAVIGNQVVYIAA